ncbi:MAG TPA: glycosyltransferase [Pyrinomonadaceae bacterium]|jgi:GT2 family glycosyltransferase
MIVARQDDLELTEYAAFNHGRDYPRMRRWELPFALHALRPPATASVLDCTINPLDFGTRLQSLYAHVTYRHHNPVQRGRFIPPMDVPDEAFDRVVCVNTLEHLLADQRETLVAEIARKLKPGGLLVLTCEYFFDSAWREPALIAGGLLRRDRAEVFDGLNRVSPRDLNELCGRHGLHALDASNGVVARADEEPRADDARLYLNTPPFNNAVVAGVFRKSGAEPTYAPRRRVALALLTWNMRDISLEALAALAREAETLGRLGHEPLVVVCDNGSTDGLREALAETDKRLAVNHRFVFNAENRGSSVARNQIIGAALEWDADYLVLLDGDIEVVPFSTFAMLRHMEDAGRVLGALGAYSYDNTNERSRATRFHFHLDPRLVRESGSFVTTGYGMFRREVFEAGVRFDVSGPFERPGWGFEDNDLAFQIADAGFAIRLFRGMRFLHRNVRSSIPLLRRDGHDPADAFARRKQHVLDKWAGVPRINDGPLSEVRQARLPHIPRTA